MPPQPSPYKGNPKLTGWLSGPFTSTPHSQLMEKGAESVHGAGGAREQAAASPQSRPSPTPPTSAPTLGERTAGNVRKNRGRRVAPMGAIDPQDSESQVPPRQGLRPQLLWPVGQQLQVLRAWKPATLRIRHLPSGSQDVCLPFKETKPSPSLFSSRPSSFLSSLLQHTLGKTKELPPESAGRRGGRPCNNLTQEPVLMS